MNKICTSLEQSQKLLELGIDINTADMFYTIIDQGLYLEVKQGIEPSKDDIPCWSLAALLEIIPYSTLGKHADETWSCASWVEKVNPYLVEGCDSPINACYEMILKLNELNFL